MPLRALLSVLIGITFCSASSAQIKPGHFPRLDNAVLLTGYPGYTLAITSPDGVDVFFQKEGREDRYSVNMTQSGDLVETVQPPDKPCWGGRMSGAIATYSVREKRWKAYTNQITDLWAAAMSPDGSKIAYAASKNSTVPQFDCDLERKLRKANEGTFAHPVIPRIGIHVLDTRTGAEVFSRDVGYVYVGDLSWSPDGTRIVYDTYENPPDQPYLKIVNSIFVLDLATSSAKKITEGSRASWSPSGEWIAYLDASPQSGDLNRVTVVHPDGAGKRVLITLGKRRFLLGIEQRTIRHAPVWSPDSKELLLDEMTNLDIGTVDLLLLDFSTLKMKRIAKGKPPVWAWIAPTHK